MDRDDESQIGNTLEAPQTRSQKQHPTRHFLFNRTANTQKHLRCLWKPKRWRYLCHFVGQDQATLAVNWGSPRVTRKISKINFLSAVHNEKVVIRTCRTDYNFSKNVKSPKNRGRRVRKLNRSTPSGNTTLEKLVRTHVATKKQQQLELRTT